MTQRNEAHVAGAAMHANCSESCEGKAHLINLYASRKNALELGRMADRCAKGLGMLLLALVVATLPLMGAERLVLSEARSYLPGPLHFATIQLQHVHSGDINRLALSTITFAGLVFLWRTEESGHHLLPLVILLTSVLRRRCSGAPHRDKPLASIDAEPTMLICRDVYRECDWAAAFHSAPAMSAVN